MGNSELIYSNVIALFTALSKGKAVLIVTLFLLLLWLVVEIFRDSKKNARYSDYQLDSILAGRKKSDVNSTREWVGFLNKVFSTNPKEVGEKLIAAGFYHPKLAQWFITLKYSMLFLGIVSVLVISAYFDLKASNLIVITAVWLIAVIIVPDSYLAMRAKSKARYISSRLPYLLDLMAVCVQTGMSIEFAMRYLAVEMEGFDHDVSFMLKRVNDRAKLSSLEVALNELLVRVPTPEMRSFVMTLSQSLQYGSSIYGVLTTLSKDIREVQLLTIEEKIGKLAAKMSVPLILFIMMPIVILVAAPGVLRMMNGQW